MKTTSKEELEGAFLEVRKAYRLLYSYQRRVLDTVKYIIDQLEVSQNSGWALFTHNMPKHGKFVDLNTNAWAWLGLYMYEFYCNEKKIGSDVYRFAIQIQSDTGCYDSWVDEIKVESYGSVEDAQTNLIFLASKNRWKAEGNKDNDYLDYHDIPALKASSVKEFTEKNENGDELFLLKSYPLSNFIDEISIQNQIKDFKNFMDKNGIVNIFEVNSNA